MFSWFYEKKKGTNDSNENKKPVNEEDQNEVLKENHQKLVFDEDF